MKSTLAIVALLGFSTSTLAQNSGGKCKFTAYADRDCKGSASSHSFGYSADCFNTGGKKSFRIDNCALAYVSPAQNKYCNPRQGKVYTSGGGACVNVDLGQLSGGKWGGAYVYEINP